MGIKKILFIGSFNLPINGQYGGVYFASTTLRDGLIKEGFQIVEMDTTLKNIAETRVSRRLPDILGRQLRFLVTILASAQASVLLVFLSGGGSYIDKFLTIVLAKIIGKKVVLFPRSGHLLEDYKKNKFKFFIDAVFKMADKVVCQSNFWADYFESTNVKSEKLFVVENWVSPKILEDSTNLDYPKFESGKEEFKIIFVSRIEKAKGVDDIIELGKVLRGKINFSIHVYGGGSYLKEFIHNIIANNLQDIIFFDGWLGKENMLKTMNSFHLGVFASHTEGYPNGLLDLIFAKVPILSSNIPMVQAVGKSYLYYYEIGDINEMAEKILKISSEYSMAGSLSQELYRKKYVENSFETIIKKLRCIM